MGIKDVFFDLDGTLWDFNEANRQAFHDLLNRYELPISLDDFFEVYNPVNQNYWHRYRLKEIGHSELEFGRLQDTFRLLKIEDGDSWINEFREAYVTRLTESDILFPHTSETLGYLQKRYHLHVITDGFSEIQKRKLKRSGIFSYFKTMTFSDEVGETKPSPVIFEAALARAGGKAEQSVMIGDHLEFDIEGAERYGLKAIHVQPLQNQKGHHNGSISSILELKKIL